MSNLLNFDLTQYLNNNNNESLPKQNPTPQTYSGDADREQIYMVANQLIASGIDITQGYQNWLNLGFALKDALGEEGRQLFHDLSRNNADYKFTECDKQYTACMRSHGSGITIKTFFQMVKDAGVDVAEVARQSLRNCAVCANAQPCASLTEKDNYLIINNSDDFTQDCAIAQSAQTAQNSEELSFHHTFTDKIADEDWCSFMQPILDSMDDVEGKDKMILGSLVVMSGVLPNYYGLYGGHVVYPPFYLIFYGPAASRKGEIRACLELLKPLKKEIRRQFEAEQEEYNKNHAEWEARGGKGKLASERGPEPKEPEFRSPIIPANSSASATYMALQANDGWGVMFETEADVITQSLLSDYGDYSTGLRQASHHEPIRLNRVKDKLHIEIEEPRLAVGVTCTPGQLPKLFPSFENGLGSRFSYFGLNQKVEWLNPFRHIDKPIEEVYAELGNSFLELYHEMKALGERRIQFVLTDSQKTQFNSFFSELLMEQFSMLGDGITSFVFRLGLTTFRLAMILALLRRFSDWNREEPLFATDEQAFVCSDKDFNIALTMMNCLVNHTAIIYNYLAKEEDNPFKVQLAQMNQQELTLFNALPDEFTSADVVEVVQSNHINPETARRYIGNFVKKYKVCSRVKNGVFAKIKHRI